MEDLTIVKDAFSEFVVNSNDALEFKLVRQVKDLEEDSIKFKPQMSHQVFGDQECIFGYKDLKIKLYYSAGSLLTYLGVSYSEKVDKEKLGVEADNVTKLIAEKLQPGFVSNLDHFCSKLANDEKFLPFGKLEHSFSADRGDGTKTYQVHHCDVSTPGFLDLHARLQTFVLWYIDAASFVDTDDDNWNFFLLYERYTEEGSIRYATIGFATVYHYYAYPKHIRPRISQMLVLPPFQRQGLGADLLNSIYCHYMGRDSVKDITVEDPAEDFQRLRDFVDVKNCSTLDSFQPEKLKSGFSKTMLTEARTTLKLNKKQARRVYEILRLKHTDTQEEEKYLAYRLDVKQRLNVPYKREETDLKKLQKVLKDQEFQTTMKLANDTLRMDSLERDYRQLEGEYRKVLDRFDH